MCLLNGTVNSINPALLSFFPLRSFCQLGIFSLRTAALLLLLESLLLVLVIRPIMLRLRASLLMDSLKSRLAAKSRVSKHQILAGNH